MRPSTPRRATAILLTSGLMIAGSSAAGFAAPVTEAPTTGLDEAKGAPARDKLGQADRQRLSEAEAQGVDQVTVLVATAPGATEGVDAALSEDGGTVGYRDDKLGYVRASVPTGAVLATAARRDVVAVDLDEEIPLEDPRAVQEAAAAPGAVPAPGPGTPDDNPYLPAGETGAVAFRAANPTWDGRGTTIGVLDSGVDLDHPALATTSTGERKIVDWVTATDPVTEGDATWRPMLTAVAGPSFTYADATWTAPAGDFRVNVFRESITTASEPGGDVNRDGDTTDAWGVLYRASDNAIWVDVDQDRDFTDETLMRPYREQYQVGHFGADDAATADVVETMPFVVEFREDVDRSALGGANVGQEADYVNIGIVESAHGSHVAGIAAGNDVYGGTADGAAPGARIVSSRACSWGGGCTAVALTEGMIDLVANRRVDVVNMSIGGLPALNDGANTRATLYDRLIDEYGVQLFISAGNSGPGVNTIGDPSVATDVVSVGSSISKETWLSNYGSEVSAELNLHNFSSRGPREDGGFKPNVTAPGSAVSTTPRWLNSPDVAETGYTLPVGLEMFNGTSMASPQAAGAAALLLSASKSQQLPITPPQLRRALYSSADFIEDVPAFAQGNGQVDLDEAWKLLRRGPVVQDYTVTAPVCTPLSDYLTTPDQGAGVYNRCAAAEGGHTAGEAKTYPVTVTRTSGAAGSSRHRITWVGNDGTFDSAAAVDLPLNEAVTVDVTATPAGGAHGAIMRLDDPRTVGVDTEVLNTVVVGSSLVEAPFSASVSGDVERNRTESLFVTVPAGARALQVNLAGIATGSQTRFIAINPYGVPVESTSSLACYTNFGNPATCRATSRSYSDPLPGVWEIEVESRRTSPFLVNPYRLTAAAQGVTVEPEQVVLPAVAAGAATPVAWSVTNGFGPVTVTPEGGLLGSARTGRPSIADGATAESTVEVPAGADSLEVSIGNPSDPGADLDLAVVFDGAVVAVSADGDSEEAVVIDDPAPGTYTIVVDGYEVPAGTTEYDIRDVFTSAGLGTLTVPGTPVELDTGETVEVAGTLTALTAPTEGRQLFGRMTVVSSEGAELGSGTVLVESVTG